MDLQLAAPVSMVLNISVSVKRWSEIRIPNDNYFLFCLSQHDAGKDVRTRPSMMRKGKKKGKKILGRYDVCAPRLRDSRFHCPAWCWLAMAVMQGKRLSRRGEGRSSCYSRHAAWRAFCGHATRWVFSGWHGDVSALCWTGQVGQRLRGRIWDFFFHGG